MLEIEAKHLAETIQRANVLELCVEAIEQFPGTQLYHIRCYYDGPTFKHGQQLFLHGAEIYIENAFEWSSLYKVLKKGFTAR